MRSEWAVWLNVWTGAVSILTWSCFIFLLLARVSGALFVEKEAHLTSWRSVWLALPRTMLGSRFCCWTSKGYEEINKCCIMSCNFFFSSWLTFSWPIIPVWSAKHLGFSPSLAWVCQRRRTETPTEQSRRKSRSVLVLVLFSISLFQLLFFHFVFVCFFLCKLIFVLLIIVGIFFDSRNARLCIISSDELLSFSVALHRGRKRISIFLFWFLFFLC